MTTGYHSRKWRSSGAHLRRILSGTQLLWLALVLLGARIASAQAQAAVSTGKASILDAGAPHPIPGTHVNAGASHAESIPSTLADASAPGTAPESSANVAKDDVALQFAGTCAGCHTVGGGNMRGPDLVGTMTWAEPQLTTAIQSMQRKAGPLTPEQVSALVGLLKDPKASARIKQARAKLSEDSESKAEPANSLVGGALFFGKTPLENGGLACSSCHQFRGEGGNLGPDLSDFALNIDVETLAGSLSRAGFPVMRAAYQSRPILLQEARHIAAFLQQARADRQSAMPPPAVNSTGLGAGMAAFACALLYIAMRPKGVRARLVQRGSKR